MEAPCGTLYDLLGPPRILNHACEPNARVKEVTGEHVAITALREIQMNEEVTIYYGKNSFGRANKTCSCATHRPLPVDSLTHQRLFWPPHNKGHEPARHPTDQHLRGRNHAHETPVQSAPNLASNSAEIRTSALTSLDRQRKNDDTFQGRDATQLHYLLSLSSEPEIMGWKGDPADACELIVMDKTQFLSVP